jgi:hypothetical protein
MEEQDDEERGAHARIIRAKLAGMKRVLVLWCAAACSQAAPRGEPTRPTATATAAPDAAPAAVPRTVGGDPRMLDGRYYVEADAPEPRACTRDTDCLGDLVTDDHGCCMINMETRPQSWAYHNWLLARRLSPSCKRTTCPPLPPPSFPDDCELDIRCAHGQCQDACQR